MATVPEKSRRRGTLRDLKTAVTARIRSKPTIEGQRYLDLYVLQRDRFRWLRLIQQSERSIQAIDLALGKMGFTSDFVGAKPATSTSVGVGHTVAGKTRKMTARHAQAA